MRQLRRINHRTQSHLFQANGFRILYSGHPTPTPSIEMLLDVNDVYAPMQGGGAHAYDVYRNWGAIEWNLRLE